MRDFDEILAIAADRHGGHAAVAAMLPQTLPKDDVAQIPDAVWLRTMAMRIFSTGMSTSMIEAKEDDIIAAFEGFDVGRVALMSDDWFDALLKDRRIIRNAPKLRAIQQNAVFIQEVSAEAGGFGRKIADWPDAEFGELLFWLKSEGARLGGSTGGYILRQLGRDGYVFSKDVVARLVAEGVVSGQPTSRKAMLAAQAAFNTWQAQSGRPLAEISRILALSI
ncbi:DNA-3-methyladenine glycosylase I [Phaeobacter sp. QD34_3]|uniref:DNA-3-methyladenine glycosylase I n=1 Tax=unclassified Phaeobacter TaxID=2621772 RepID=UPI00237F8B69|nr:MULTISPECIES: DNA-3-methyladenine glycosylase I [unclassified Phaeobacter]MDE4131992.1 DNA-3-methyladenine glycosylase I [Phaeobacter sp. QD34_3]MDE4135630.1 DNA-3-methyladenine glycosylase I [Phaeobacter sp. QD34_24]